MTREALHWQRSLRIAVVAASLDIVGGQGVQAHELVSRLRRDGYRVDFVAINPRFPTGLGWARRVPFLRTLINQFLYLSSLPVLRHDDVVHAFSASYWSFLLAPVPAIMAARLFGKRVIIHYHSGEAADHLERWGALVHPWLRMADEIVVPSQFLRRVFGRFGYPARVVNNIVDTRRFRFRERIPLQPRLLSVRNLEPYYRVDVTIRAFKRIKARFPLATLVIAGSGSQEGALRRLVESLDLDGITFMGSVDPASIHVIYDEAHIFVNSSTLDNQPVSVLEAFAAGLPVVSTPTGDIGAMLRSGETGVIVPPEDPEALSTAVVKLLQAPQTARELVRRAHEEMVRYSWPEIRKEWAAVYALEAA